MDKIYAIRSVLFVVIVVALLTIGNAALGQEMENYQKIDTITVTAEKREENVQDVPISMSVFNDIQIEDAGIKDLTDLTYFTPNVYAKQNSSLNTITIRGISSHNCTVNPPAGLFVDGISYPISFMQNPDLVDIERVEVLRGPQGTLYGRNAESGVINIHTKQPDNEFRGKLFSNTGIYDTSNDDAFFYILGGSLSGPIIKNRVFMGVSFQSENSDGYIKNIFNGDDNVGETDHKVGQGKIRWTPNDQLDVSLVMNVNENEDFYNNSFISGPYKTERYTINWDGSDSWKEENNGQALKVEYAGTAFDFVSITARNNFKADYQYDLDLSPQPGGDMINTFDNTMISQDLRLSSPKDAGTFKWLVGLFGFKDENDIKSDYSGVSRFTDFENKGIAAYGQTTYTLLDRLHLTAGLRYEHQESDGKQINSSVAEPFSSELEYDEILPKISLSYDVKKNLMFYTTVSKGFLAGGYDYSIATGVENLTFDPEYTWNYEAGIKTSWFDKRLILNMSAFYIDIQDKQVMQYDAGRSWHVSNAAEASSKGLELEFEARPTQGLHFFGGLGVIDAKIDNWISNGVDYKDNNLPSAPKYTYNVGVKYSHHTGLFGRADIFGTGDIYTDPENTQKIDAYNTVNLSFGFQRETFDIVLWGENIFDKEYLTNKNASGTDSFVEFGQPRTNKDRSCEERTTILSDC